MSYLLDTNVLSELRKTSPNRGVSSWFGEVTGQQTLLSVITVGEIRRGIAKLRCRRDHRQAETYDRWLTKIRGLFIGRLIPVDTQIAEAWGEIEARRSIPTADGLIAATAKVHDLTVVTRNVRDFIDAGVSVLNPFSD